MWNLLIDLCRRFIILTGCILLLSACNNRPHGVLNQEDMTNILTEMHKTDASMIVKGMNFSSYSDKAPYYSSIFKKYNINQAKFDSSLVWYSKNPRIFGNIYTKVMINLNSLQKDVKNGKYHPEEALEMNEIKSYIWNKRTRYILTRDSARTHLSFEINDNNLFYGDTYILKFLLRIAPEDSCKKPRVLLCLNYANGKTDSVYRTAFNDSLLRRYTFRLKAFRKLKIKSISGELLASKVYKGKLNATIDSISLYREFNPTGQDSLHRLVEKANPGVKFNFQKPTIESSFNSRRPINRRFNHSLK